MFNIRVYDFDLYSSTPTFVQTDGVNFFKSTVQPARALRFRSLPEANEFCTRHKSYVAARKLFIAPREMSEDCDHCWHPVTLPADARVCCRCNEYRMMPHSAHGSFVPGQSATTPAPASKRSTAY